jgi:hypothetical protein
MERRKHCTTKGLVMDDDSATIVVCENGPYIVRGTFALTTTDDEPIEAQRQVIALCRCGRSSVKPFCDGTHALLRDVRKRD